MVISSTRMFNINMFARFILPGDRRRMNSIHDRESEVYYKMPQTTSMYA